MYYVHIRIVVLTIKRSFYKIQKEVASSLKKLLVVLAACRGGGIIGLYDDGGTKGSICFVYMLHIYMCIK